MGKRLAAAPKGSARTHTYTHRQTDRRTNRQAWRSENRETAAEKTANWKERSAKSIKKMWRKNCCHLSNRRATHSHTHSHIHFRFLFVCVCVKTNEPRRHTAVAPVPPSMPPPTAVIYNTSKEHCVLYVHQVCFKCTSLPPRHTHTHIYQHLGCARVCVCVPQSKWNRSSSRQNVWKAKQTSKSAGSDAAESAREKERQAEWERERGRERDEASEIARLTINCPK